MRERILILIIQMILLVSARAENDTSIVNMVFRLCGNQKSLDFPYFDKRSLTYFFSLNQDTLKCELLPIINKFPHGDATMEEGTRMTISREKKEYMQQLFIPGIDINGVMFITISYKDCHYFFRRNMSKFNVFEMLYASSP